MDTSVFVPVLNAVYDLLSQVNGQWAAIAALAILLMRAGVLQFPFKVPFLSPKSPAAPIAPATPVDPSAPSSPVVPPVVPILDVLGEKLKEWLAERLKARFGELVEKGSSHDEAFSHLADAIKSESPKTK